MNYEFHEAANIFPMMEGQGYKDLVSDIAVNGLQVPIVLHEEKILDGRNRYRACLELGLSPEFVHYEGDNPFSYVVSLNLKRRHLDESQRAMVAAKLANLQKGDNRFTVDRQICPSISQNQAAELLNVGTTTVKQAKQVIDHGTPELIHAVEQGEIPVSRAVKEIRSIEIKAERQALADTAKDIEPDNRWRIYQGDVATWNAPRQYDFIITDPPYPKEFLTLYEVLAIRANEWLTDDGLLIAMCGQSYLNQIYEMMSKHLTYYWTACYLLPGQPTPLRTRQVNTSWKPLLIFSRSDYKGKIFGDVFKSDGNDKDFHKWGQSVSGMTSIISQICLPGKYILDPFCGAGTTGIAALAHGCLFDGLELEAENVNISKARLNDTTKA